MSASPGAGPAPFWCLAQLKPNGLNLALRNLARQGFETFAPRLTITRRHGKRFRGAKTLLFPGYVFVETGSSPGRWRAINSTLGIARLVRFGDSAPARISPELIESLRLRCDEAGLLQPIAELEAGDQVRLLRGPFADFVATVEKVEPDRRVWLLIDMLGRQTRLAAAVGDVTAA